MATAYQTQVTQNQPGAVQDALETLVREGARRMLAAALEEEVNAFLGRQRYQRSQEFRGYRNGYHPARQLTVGVGAVDVRVPRVAQVAPEGFQSQIVARYQRVSQTTQRLFVRLYLEAWRPAISSRCSGVSVQVLVTEYPECLHRLGLLDAGPGGRA
ncbi:MAG: transposase [Chloroflexi bacterium]|nr:transposase [Chloroflexota bacterium]